MISKWNSIQVTLDPYFVLAPPLSAVVRFEAIKTYHQQSHLWRSRTCMPDAKASVKRSHCSRFCHWGCSLGIRVDLKYESGNVGTNSRRDYRSTTENFWHLFYAVRRSATKCWSHLVIDRIPRLEILMAYTREVLPSPASLSEQKAESWI